MSDLIGAVIIFLFGYAIGKPSPAPLSSEHRLGVVIKEVVMDIRQTRVFVGPGPRVSRVLTGSVGDNTFEIEIREISQ